MMEGEDSCAQEGPIAVATDDFAYEEEAAPPSRGPGQMIKSNHANPISLRITIEEVNNGCLVRHSNYHSVTQFEDETITVFTEPRKLTEFLFELLTEKHMPNGS